jgi:opacity protein-like surface antigen
MRHWIPALALGAAMFSAAPAAAQLAAEVRLDAGIPVDETGEIYEAGVGFGLRGSLDIAPSFAVYGGYSQFDLEVDDDILPDAELEISGWELGGRVGIGHGAAASPYFLLGALFVDDDTGLEAGVGAEYGVSWNLAVTPEVRYRRVNDLTYLTLGMGARFRF